MKSEFLPFKLAIIFMMVFMEVGIGVLARVGLAHIDIDPVTKMVIELYIFIHGIVFFVPIAYIFFSRKELTA